jgi:CheY-like chemotaxis protein
MEFLPQSLAARRLLKLERRSCTRASHHYTTLYAMAHRQRILILDDEQDLLEIYQEILARLPSQPEIQTASSGTEAIAALEANPFALLLVDLNMPQMDGFQVLAIVRRRFPTLRTVVMTGATDDDLRGRAYRIGVDLYIEKPKTGREIIFFVDCIESLLERESQGGFRGVQSKTLMDIIQLECLTQSTSVLKITSELGEGRVWIQKGEIIDATIEDKSGKDAIVEMLGWKAGNFEVLPYGLPRPRTIFMNYESLLMETAQTLDEAAENAGEEQHSPETVLASFARFTGVQFSIAVESGERMKYEHWGADEPAPLALWIKDATASFKALGQKLDCGELLDAEALGQQRHLSIISGDDEALGIGFTRALGLGQIRETLKQIEAKWAS